MIDFLKTFDTREAIVARIEEIRLSTPQRPSHCETAPNGKPLTEISARLYSELIFLQQVLEQSIIKYPVTVPRFSVR